MYYILENMGKIVIKKIIIYIIDNKLYILKIIGGFKCPIL